MTFEEMLDHALTMLDAVHSAVVPSKPHRDGASAETAALAQVSMF